MDELDPIEDLTAAITDEHIEVELFLLTMKWLGYLD